MKFFKSSLVRSMGIYTLTNVINSAIPFLLLPLLTIYLSPADYGILTNFNSLLALLIPFISLNLMTSLQVIYVKKSNELTDYISTGIFTTIFLTFVFTAVIFVFSSQISDFTGVPVQFIWFVSIYATFQNIVEVLLSLWRMEDKAIQYGVFRIVRTIIELGLAIILIVYYGKSFSGSIEALAISYGIGTVFTLIYLVKKRILVWTFKRVHLNYLVRYGVPLIPHVLGSVVIMYTDKLALTYYHGLAANGVYSVGFMVAQVIGLLQNSFNQAWVPWVFKELAIGKKSVQKQIVKWTYIYFIGIIVVSLVFYLFTPLIFHFLGKSYAGGMTLVLWIALGFAFNGMYKMVGVYFFYMEKTGTLASISIFTAAINIGLAILLIPSYGFFGAAIGTMISFLIQFLLTWWLGNRIYPMPWFGSKESIQQ